MTTPNAYFIAQDGSQSGPFTVDAIREKQRLNEISPTAMVWAEGMPDWQPIEKVIPSTLIAPPPLPTSPPPLPALSRQESPSKSSTGCIWSAIAATVLVIGSLYFLTHTFIQRVRDEMYAGDSEKPLAEERTNHQTTWIESDFAPTGPPDPPPEDIFDLIEYDSPAGKLAAYVTPDPGDGKRHPAMVWAKGGFGGIGRFLWDEASKRDDQSARAFRDKGIVLMCPSWRAENENPGRFELFLGEVDDFKAAIRHIKTLPYVDPERVYIGGHSTGGTLTLLTCVSSNDFRAAFSFGGMPDGVEILNHGGYGNTPYDEDSLVDHRLRSAIRYTRFIERPTFYFEGSESDYPAAASRMQALAEEHDVPFQAFALPGDHFDILHPITHHVADLILADTGPEFATDITKQDLVTAYEAAFENALANTLPNWTPEGGTSLEEYLEAFDADDTVPHSLDDVDAVANTAKQLATAPVSETSLNDFATLIDLQLGIEYLDTWDAFSKQVIPIAISKVEALLLKANSLDEKQATALLRLTAAIVEADTSASLQCGVATARSRLKAPGYAWSPLFSYFDAEHADTTEWHDALAKDLPPTPTARAVLLESANDTFLDGWEGFHPFDTPQGISQLNEWLTDPDSEPAYSAHPSALGLAFLESEPKRIRTLLDTALKHPDRDVQREAAWSDVRLGGSVGIQFLKAECLDVHRSVRAQSYLEELERSEVIPAKALEPKFAATAEMSNWLQHPNEIGTPPLTIEQIDHRSLFWPPDEEERDVWLFRFTYRFDDDEETQTGFGMVGGMTWSSFIDYETPPTPEELYLHHCALELEWSSEAEEERGEEELRRISLKALQDGNPSMFIDIGKTSRRP